MKQILLLSDSHSHIELELNPFLEKADEIWHAGDFGSVEVIQWLESFGKTFRGVWGNIDNKETRNLVPEDNIFEVEKVKIWMTHIGGYPGRYSPRVRKLFETHQANLFVCGHSHIVKLEQDNKYNHWVFNPGAAGREGFHHVKTALSFVIDGNNINQVKIIDLGKR